MNWFTYHRQQRYRLHVRGFDRKTQTFRDFVINRISQVKHVDADLAQYEVRANDHLWNRMVTLKLVPHPHNAHIPTAVEMEFEMIDGCLTVELRAALVGYYLRQNNVDASENAELRGEPILWLQNRGSVLPTSFCTGFSFYKIIELKHLFQK